MGIPALYRWLSERYPLSVVRVKEEPPRLVNGVQIPIDTTNPNPNGFEFDNLYLDMNGIIHPCFHPESDNMPPPTSYDEVYKAVFKYVDRVFSLVRPRKLLFMAIDGVAPRAKMNQQRARRFKAAKEREQSAAKAEKLKENKLVSSEKAKKKLDSNVITPGTEFMASLSNALQFYIQHKLNTDPGWKQIKVILSDSNVPGEGEHKVASYIRLQRNLPGYDPNTRHCLYGLDADLIMLGLATHEIHFSILREDIRPKHQIDRRQSFGNRNNQNNKKSESKENKQENSIDKIIFQFMHIWILREYLEFEFRIPEARFKIETNRLIDDYVFICLFVGNDFLPHIPSLQINEGALDLLMNVYKKEFFKMGGYLTNSFEVNLERVEHFLQAIGSHETAIFRRRLEVKQEKEIRFGKDPPVCDGDSELNPGNIWMSGSEVKETDDSKMSFQNESNKKDKVATIEEGWKERYYNEKFEVETLEERTKLKNHTVLKYVEGICWFMRYYYQGVCSWNWYYPYHYAPFASDFIHLKSLEIKFTLGQPFKPFDQLMGVLPAASSHALPATYRNLMMDPSSSIIDFYPKDFELDLNGKRFSWQAICKLPFINESRLLEEIQKVEPALNDEERDRNSCGLSALYFHTSHALAPKIISFYKKKKDHPKLTFVKLKKKLRPKLSGGMNGTIYISEKTVQSSEIYSPIEGIESIKNNETIFVYYAFPSDHEHIAQIPKGAILPTKFILKRNLVPEADLWHERTSFVRRVNPVRPVYKSIGGNNFANHHLNQNNIQNQNGNIVEKEEILGKRKRTEEISHEGEERIKIEENVEKKAKKEKKDKKREKEQIEKKVAMNEKEEIEKKNEKENREKNNEKMEKMGKKEKKKKEKENRENNDEENEKIEKKEKKKKEKDNGENNDEKIEKIQKKEKKKKEKENRENNDEKNEKIEEKENNSINDGNAPITNMESESSNIKHRKKRKLNKENKI